VSNGAWTRGEKIAVLSIFIAIVTCIATIVLVPEVRKWVGFDSSTTPKSANFQVEKSNSTNLSKPSPQGQNISRITSPDDGTNSKLDGISFDSSISTTIDGWLRISPIDVAEYANEELYIKMSICNVGGSSDSASYLYAWYTPPYGQNSVSWTWSWELGFTLMLKPGECEVKGGWSNKVQQPFQLKRPFGKLYFSTNSNHAQGVLDLSQLDSQNLVR
jgi:hypothetical protein